MSNEELYKKLKNLFNEKQLIIFSYMICEMYNIKYNDDLSKGKIPSENEYDKIWWTKKHQKLLNKI